MVFPPTLAEPLTPIPPVITNAPDCVSLDSNPLLIEKLPPIDNEPLVDILPPTFKFFPTPRPPETTAAPVPIEVDCVIDSTFNCPPMTAFLVIPRPPFVVSEPVDPAGLAESVVLLNTESEFTFNSPPYIYCFSNTNTTRYNKRSIIC